MAKVGRPSSFSPELAETICQMIADGASMRTIAKIKGMPSAAAVCRWLGELSSFREQYARACELRADAIFEEAIEIADNSTQDFIETENGPVFVNEHVQRSRLRVDTRKWAAGKLNPKKYGDKSTVDVNVRRVSELTDAELAAQLAELDAGRTGEPVSSSSNSGTDQTRH